MISLFLRKNLYDLCNLIYFPYSSLNTLPDLSHFTEESVLKYLNSKADLKSQWNKKNNTIISDFKFSFKYKIIEQNSRLLKLRLSITDSFLLNPDINKIISSSIDDYILIAEYSKKHNIKIYALISKEEDTLLYCFLNTNNLDIIDDFLPIRQYDIWDADSKLLDSLLNKIRSLYYHFPPRKVKEISKFSIENACNYAERFALIPNGEYISFEKSGGDCTNFASQIIHAGGLSTTYTWKPYSNAWLRVEELYLYLINNKLAYKVPDDSYLSRGALIQFKTPKLGRFFHTGFITHKLINGECLYCCHSYNKLNYPLSNIYPILYPQLRGLHFI